MEIDKETGKLNPSIAEIVQDMRANEEAQARPMTAEDVEDHRTARTRSRIERASAYAPLATILNAALDQASAGKGHDRHSDNKPFLSQPILEIPRMLGIGGVGGHVYQIMKKSQEANRMAMRGRYDAAVRELYGVINYAAAAVILIQEIEAEAGNPDSGAGLPVPVTE